jgi:hypothetical protein
MFTFVDEDKIFTPMSGFCIMTTKKKSTNVGKSICLIWPPVDFVFPKYQIPILIHLKLTILRPCFQVKTCKYMYIVVYNNIFLENRSIYFTVTPRLVVRSKIK